MGGIVFRFSFVVGAVSPGISAALSRRIRHIGTTIRNRPICSKQPFRRIGSLFASSSVSERRCNASVKSIFIGAFFFYSAGKLRLVRAAVRRIPTPGQYYTLASIASSRAGIGVFVSFHQLCAAVCGRAVLYVVPLRSYRRIVPATNRVVGNMHTLSPWTGTEVGTNSTDCSGGMRGRSADGVGP